MEMKCERNNISLSILFCIALSFGTYLKSQIYKTNQDVENPKWITKVIYLAMLQTNDIIILKEVEKKIINLNNFDNIL